jgi:K+/H+ antiporter YhaU regulatory subunit KhtT
MTIIRETGVVNVNPSSTEELRDGDTIDIVGGVSLRRVVFTYHHLVC